MNFKNKQPTIYEINAPIFLNEIGWREGRSVTFADVPDSDWDTLAELHIDMIWFMGVWRRSPAARELAYSEPWLQKSLSGIQKKDILGSAYSIHAYVVDELLGGNEGLAIARQKLKERGIGLMLDFVPNHVGLDHHWATEHPEYLLSGTPAELKHDHELFVQTAGGIFARGKDPNFPPWSDVLQLNAFSPGLRQATTETLKTIASMSDAVRCDMAMLMMNNIFKKTWGTRAGVMPPEEYWTGIIRAVRKASPDFLFLAEVYWEKEEALLEQGFDLCYDKKLYDFLLEGSAHDIKKYIQHVAPFQHQLLRFIENHDEKRAAHEFSFHKHTAAAAIIATLPGAHLYHEGQLEGRQVKLPVHLGRREDEPVNEQIVDFYKRLFLFTQSKAAPHNQWRRLPVKSVLPGWESRHILAWTWQTKKGNFAAVINYSPEIAKGYVPFLNKKTIQKTTDLLRGIVDASSVVHRTGVTLKPRQCVIFELA